MMALTDRLKRGMLAGALVFLMLGHLCAGGEPRQNVVSCDRGTPSTRWLPVHEDGWTILKPSADSRIMFVSSSEGDDATGKTYGPGDPDVGKDPFHPVGPVKPFKTIAAGMAEARAERPDWVLLKRGEVWLAPLGSLPNGRSQQEPFLVSAYGTAAERPLLKGSSPSVHIGSSKAGTHYVAVVSVEVYPSWLDPESSDYSLDANSKRRLARCGVHVNSRKGGVNG